MSAESAAAAASDPATTAALEVRLFVAGAWRMGGAGWLDVEDPATGRSAGRVALANADDVRAAIAAAQAAFDAWAITPAAERGAVLKRAAALLAERTPDVARTLALEAGKTQAEALAEIGRAVQTLAWNGEEAGRIEGRVIAGVAPGGQRLSVPAPVGVVAAFTAWNFPAVLAARKLGAILAAGCTAVLKAAEATPGTAAEVVRALADAGAPAGTVNLVFGDPARGLRAADRGPRGPRRHLHRLDQGRSHRRRASRRRPQARCARARWARAGDRRTPTPISSSRSPPRCRRSSVRPGSRASRPAAISSTSGSPTRSWSASPPRCRRCAPAPTSDR